MSSSKRIQLLASVAAAAFAVSTAALAQAAADAPSELEEVVVTGTTSSAQRKLDASFSITTANQEAIEEAAPTSTADLLALTPGLWVESTGGTAGANVFIRGFPAGGDAPFLTIQLDGAPIFPPPTLSFLENSSLFRLDDTVERVEVLRGGPSPIFSNGQAGATANFIQKKGGATPSGSAKITLGSEGLYRVDGFYGAPIDADTSFSLGGFYRRSDGLLDTQFPADNGGQVVGTLTRRFEQGEATFYARYTKDKNAFYTGTPLISRNGGRDISEFPGFNAGRDTLIGNETRLAVLETFSSGARSTLRRDFADGRGLDLLVTGMSLDYDFGDWRVANRMNYLDGAADTRALFTGGTPQRLSAFTAAAVARANTTTPVIVAAGRQAFRGDATFVNGGGAVDPNQFVLTAGLWSVDKDIRSFTDELRVSRELFEGNTVTVGAYYATYESKDRWLLGNDVLMTAQPNGRLVDVVLDNGVRVTRSGFVGATSFAVNAAYNGENMAAFVADEWQITERLRLDAGFRVERQKVDATLENLTNGVDFDGNPLTLYNNSGAALNGSFRTIDFSRTETSWTAGLNYTVTETFSAFARANRGFKFPQFDDLRDGQRVTQKVDQYEVGLKTVTELYSAYVTAFYNDFEGLIFTRIVQGPNGGLMAVSDVGGSQAKGVEFEGQVRPLEGVAVDLRGAYQDAEYKDFGANSGNRVARQPRWQFAVTPSYTADLGFGNLKVWAGYTYVGNRFSDQENAQRLPSYDTWDMGARLEMANGVDVLLTGENLTNELGLTEGNARVIGSGTVDNIFLARPIFGRHFTLSVAYRF